jgi:hypothetical protein
MLSPIFSKPIARPIGPSDMEFYEGGIVLRMALIMSGYDDAGWDALTCRTRRKWLDRATRAACRLLNDSAIVARLPLLADNLRQRA